MAGEVSVQGPLRKDYAGAEPIVQPADTQREISYGAALPGAAYRVTGLWHIFSVAVGGGLVWQAEDGTPLTAAARGDIARWSGAAWVRIGRLVFSGGADRQNIVIATADHLRQTLAAQAKAETSLGIYFSEAVQLDGETYAKGTVATVDPLSSTVEVWYVAGGENASITPDGKVTAGLFSQPVLDYLGLGDTLNPLPINEEATLRAHISNQPRNEEPAWMVATADFDAFIGGDIYNVRAGDIWYMRPRADGTGVMGKPYRIFSLKQQAEQAGLKFETMQVWQASGLPGIANTADIDGAYVAYLPSVRKAGANVQHDNVRIFVLDSGDTGYQVHQAPFAYGAGGAHLIPFTIDPTEEGNARLQAAIATTPGFLRIGLRFYDTNVPSGLVVYNMPIAPGFVLPSGATEGEIDAAVDRYLAANPPPAGEDSVARRAAVANKTSIDEIIANGWVRETRLSQTLQAALLDMRITPVRDAVGGEYQIVFANGGILRGDFFYKVEANGQTVIARKEWDSPASITFTPTADQVTRMTAVSPEVVTVVVTFYPDAAGLELTNHARNIAIRPAAKPAADKDVGGAFNIGNRAIWHAYDMTEDREAAAWYQFLLRDGGSERYTPTQAFRGDFLPANAGGAFAQGEENQLGLIIARVEADGGRVLSVARDANNARRLYLSTNSSWNVAKLIKLGR